ncbi:MAG TPA: hypothetical protein VK629_18515 [Steroidobacteraceae bacterium]|nr:hypothetical protein [Steroidobacteraceae bacterium]
MRACFVALCFSILAAGCATSEIRVYVDLYDEDPRFIAPMSPEEVAELIANLERLRAAAKDKTGQRKYLADASVDMYLETLYQINDRPADERREDVRKAAAGGRDPECATGDYAAQLICKRDRYKDAANEAFNEQGALIDAAIEKLNVYFGHYRDEYNGALEQFEACERERLKKSTWFRNADTYRDSANKACQFSEKGKRKLQRLDDEWILRRLPIVLREEEAYARSYIAKAVAGYRGFAAPLKDSFVLDWVGLRADIYTVRENSTSSKPRENKAKRAAQSMNARLELIAKSTNLIPRSKIDEAIEKDARAGATGLFDATIEIAVELESLRTDLPEDAASITALSGLVRRSSRFVEMIDRLQDAGDAVWRTVTSKENSMHWNNKVALTRFYAEGKSNVVIVRQDAMRYDIHEGTNNPAALIKGQLEVTRAIANAAINVVGAASGFKVPGEGTKPGDPATDNAAAATANQQAAEAFAQRKAKAEEEERARQNALRGLSVELTNILRNLASNSSDATLKAQRAQLASVLKAYKSLLAVSGK